MFYLSFIDFSHGLEGLNGRETGISLLIVVLQSLRLRSGRVLARLSSQSDLKASLVSVCQMSERRI